MSRKSAWWRMAVIMCVVCQPIVIGCSGEEEADAESTAAANPYPTADAVLAEYNRLITQPTPDWGAVGRLMYAENDFQRMTIGMLEKVGRMTELVALTKEKFGRVPADLSSFSKGMDSFQNTYSAATISRRLDRRVEATYRNTKTKQTETLQLVEIGGRWWVSGYSFEKQTGDAEKDKMAKEIAGGMLGFMGEALGAITDEFLPRIKSGGIASIEQFESELQTFKATFNKRMEEKIKNMRPGGS